MPMPLANVTSPMAALEGRDLLLRFTSSAMKAQSKVWKGPEDQRCLHAVKVCLASRSLDSP